MPNNNNYILALDVGDTRVGVAIASSIARLPRPHGVLLNDDEIWDRLKELINEENIGTVIVGLPRNLDGVDTAQTRQARNFAEKLSSKTSVNVVLQDEALTSRKAESELRSKKKQYNKGDIDALAATYILEDFLNGPDSIYSGGKVL